MSSTRFFVSIEKDGPSQKEGLIQCTLCPRRCVLAPGGEGACKVRINRGGKPTLPFYGFITALAKDPIEKKPLYHFRPGAEILSAGFAGCNLHCPFCQNSHISQNTDVPGRFCTPSELVEAAGQSALAYTYSEPLVHIEFLLDCMKEARKAGIANVLVSNGCINSEAAEEILSLTDAANIDLKCFSEKTYSELLGGDLSTVLEFIKTACKKGVHVELTTLVVPGLNDSEEELDACVNFIAGLGDGEYKEAGKSHIPWHLSAYHPDWKWKAPATSPEFLDAAAARARRKLSYVYTGNVAGEKNNTLCLHCGKILIGRRGYRVDTTGLSIKKDNGKPSCFCASCGKAAPVQI